MRLQQSHIQLIVPLSIHYKYVHEQDETSIGINLTIQCMAMELGSPTGTRNIQLSLHGLTNWRSDYRGKIQYMS